MKEKINWVSISLNLLFIFLLILIIIDITKIDISNEVIYKSGYLQSIIDVREREINPFFDEYILDNYADISFIKFRLILNDEPSFSDSLLENIDSIFNQLIKLK